MFDQIVRQIDESNLRFTRVLRIVITERIDYQIGDPAVAPRFNRGCAIGKGLLDVLDNGPFVPELCSWRILVARYFPPRPAVESGLSVVLPREPRASRDTERIL